jgi:hypothetical protein
MATETTNIILQSITCVKPSESEHDEVFIKYSEDGGREKRFPAKSYEPMKAGDVWNVALPLSFKDTVVVSLFDNDFIGEDFLGSHTYQSSDPQPETVTVSNPKEEDTYRLYTVPAAAQG